MYGCGKLSTKYWRTSVGNVAANTQQKAFK